jgi:hypothetical protein
MIKKFQYNVYVHIYKEAIVTNLGKFFVFFRFYSFFFLLNLISDKTKVASCHKNERAQEITSVPTWKKRT